VDVVHLKEDCIAGNRRRKVRRGRGTAEGQEDR